LTALTGHHSQDWKPVKNHEDGYLINSDGVVYSLKTGKVLKSQIQKEYRTIWLSPKRYPIHKLVYTSFHGLIPDGKVINHKDSNTLNNSIQNLEAVTRRENTHHGYSKRNQTSKKTGVCWNKDKKKWVAQITIDGKQKYLGSFSEEEVAYCVVLGAMKDNKIESKYA